MVVQDHGGALDYDLMTRTAYTLEDVGGRLRMRSLSHFLQYLPPDSATMRELNPEDAEKVAWSMGRVDSQILAAIVDEVRGLQWMYAKTHSKGSVQRPKAFQTPWTEGEETGVTRYGSDPIRVGDFDAWFDRTDESKEE